MKIRSIVDYIRLGPYLIYCYFAWILRYSRHPEKYPFAKRYARFKKLANYAMKIAHPNLFVQNGEYLKQYDHPFLGVANHRYYLDPFFLAYISNFPVSFIAKKEVEKIPFVGRVFKSIDGRFIDREDLLGQIRLFKEIAERLKKGDLAYFIFPEGTRMKQHEQCATLPYKDGSLKLAYWANVDVVYAAHLGTETIFDAPVNHKKKPIVFHFFPPIKNKDLLSKKTTEVMPMIQKETNKMLVKIDQENKKYLLE
ncbi:MAG: 1-acyl-sn-glycerol-3-phosphate acyltransferase [Bacilli bacterium]|nr:1-acyl-sn-glycerol-3-phosphate acyltransferase [Bacilli bacterium]